MQKEAHRHVERQVEKDCRGRPEKPAPVFDKQAFLSAVENAQKLNLQCAELTRQLRTTRQSVTSLKAFGGSPLPKRPEGD